MPVRIVIRRIGGEESDDPFLISATSNIDPTVATALYKKRWDIETMFATLKSRGFNLEETHVTKPHVTKPGKVENLIGLLALTFGWAHLVGEERAARQGGPLSTCMGERNGAYYAVGWTVCKTFSLRPSRKTGRISDV